MKDKEVANLVGWVLLTTSMLQLIFVEAWQGAVIIPLILASNAFIIAVTTKD